MIPDPLFPEAGTVARVRAPLAPLLGEPRIAAALTSQLLAGQVVQLRRCDAPWCEVQGDDGYVGWTHAGYLEPASGDEARWRVTLGSRVREADGRERLLPFGARVAPDAELLDGEALGPEERAQRFPPSTHAIAASARRWFRGAGYTWGGVTPWGVDCSGLVQAIVRLHGVSLPRDAWQQAEVGEAIAREHARAADLHFFTDRADGRVTHVAMALDRETFVHSALARGGVRLEQWDDPDPVVRRLAAQHTGTRRVVG
jgi:hypothetical protein